MKYILKDELFELLRFKDCGACWETARPILKDVTDANAIKLSEYGNLNVEVSTNGPRSFKMEAELVNEECRAIFMNQTMDFTVGYTELCGQEEIHFSDEWFVYSYLS